jgi:3-hydroxyisobutyrate dehydrogenase
MTTEALRAPGRPSVAVLGTGIMGSAMARNLLTAGLPTTVWDRSPEATAPLAAAGAVVADSAHAAIRDARIVITMLPDAEVVQSVLFADAQPPFAAGAAWAQMGTIGVAATAGLAERLARLRPDVMFVDAPVSGSKGPAEAGQLLILASGPDAAQPVLAPAFAAIGRKTVWLGPAGQGSRMKLVVNTYLSFLIEGVAEALELGRRLGVDPAGLDAVLEGGPLDAPLVDAKLHKIAHGDFSAEFPLEWALKDVDLAIDAGRGTSLPMLAALSRQWHRAVEAGYGRDDISAARLALGNATEQDTA